MVIFAIVMVKIVIAILFKVVYTFKNYSSKLSTKKLRKKFVGGF